MDMNKPVSSQPGQMAAPPSSFAAHNLQPKSSVAAPDVPQSSTSYMPLADPNSNVNLTDYKIKVEGMHQLKGKDLENLAKIADERKNNIISNFEQQKRNRDKYSTLLQYKGVNAEAFEEKLRGLLEHDANLVKRAVAPHDPNDKDPLTK